MAWSGRVCTCKFQCVYVKQQGEKLLSLSAGSRTAHAGDVKVGVAGQPTRHNSAGRKGDNADNQPQCLLNFQRLTMYLRV